MHVIVRRIVVLVILVVLLLWISSAGAVARYRLQPIELPEAPECGVVRGDVPKPILNDQGQVAGSLKSCGFFWDQGKTTILGEQHPEVDTQVAAINNSGQIVFNSTVYDATGNPQNTYAYLWDKGASQDLGALGATTDGRRFTLASDINANGQIVGHSTVYDGNGGFVNHAFLWQDNHLIDLVVGTAYAGQSSYAPAINDHAQVVFNSWVAPPDALSVPSPVMDTVNSSLSIFTLGSFEFSRPLLWQNGALTTLAYTAFSYLNSYGEDGYNFSFNGVDYGNIKTLNVNTLFFGYAYDINNVGAIVGQIRDYSLSDDGSYYATALWQPDGSLRKIEGAAIYGHRFSKDAKINNQSQVVMAHSYPTPSDYSNRILVSNGGEPYNDVGGGAWRGPRIPFFDMNDQGQVVWTALTTDTSTSSTAYNIHKKAFVYQDGGVFNLNDLIPGNIGWNIESTYAINNVGQILVGGDKGYALLIPVTQAPCGANLGDSL